MRPGNFVRLVSLSKAKEKGLKRYFTGIKCIHGHLAERYVSSENCVICNKLRLRRSRKNNPEGWRVYHRNWYKINRDKRRAYCRARCKTLDPIKERIRRRKSRNAHPEAARTRCRRKAARRRKAIGYHTAEDIKKLLIKQDGKCVGIRCTKKLSDRYHVDHKKPLSRGGSNYPRNLQLLCEFCNCSKGAKTMKEWRKSRGIK